tara:strand:+ start:590 stop:1672 length:1083 start_codon:yes stop_codon:yes gene_type:complete
MNQKLLLATTNKGKITEMQHFFDDLSLDILTLGDLPVAISPPKELGETIEDNAILKARYYAEKTGMLTLADDTGLFVDALNGAPGVRSARIGTNETENQCTLLLEKLEGIDRQERGAQFRGCLALCNPKESTLFTTVGQTSGVILEDVVTEGVVTGYGYNRLFFVEKDAQHPEATGKTYAEMSLREKNSVSHRGKALIKMKYHLAGRINPEHIILANAVVFRNGQVLINKRNDPHNSDLHGKWEFPGGGMDFGETIEENLRREVFEEAGYNVSIVDQLGKIYVHPIERLRSDGSTVRYQLYVIPHICTVESGDGVVSDNEVLLSKWVELHEMGEYDFIDSKEVIQEIVTMLKEKIKEHNL